MFHRVAHRRALRIEHGGLRHYHDMRFHGVTISALLADSTLCGASSVAAVNVGRQIEAEDDPAEMTARLPALIERR